jgi:streptomycin 6-kinase
MKLDNQFVKRIIGLKRQRGEQWLNGLPEMLQIYEQKWNIKISAPFPLSYNYVAPALTNDDKKVVIKISFPENTEFEAEIAALKFFHGDVAIRVLQEDLQTGVVLLERAVPGDRLRSVTSDEEQIHIASQLFKKLHKPVATIDASIFPTLADWAKAFDRYRMKNAVQTGPVSKKLFDKAEGIFTEYQRENKEQVLLHGDLHTDNILSSARGWLAIDPKGVVGEREFELGAFLRNPLYDFPKGTDYKKEEARRILQFSEDMGFEKNRIRDWAFAYAVISILWFLEDENQFKEIYVKNAELIDEIKF